MRLVFSRRFLLGRVVLVSASISATLVTSVVGEALVLHQHGVTRAHLHVLGYGDILSNAAYSSKFGHTSCPDSALRSASRRVQLFTIVKTGSIFVSSTRDARTGAAELVPLHHCAPTPIAPSLEVVVDDFPVGPFLLQAGSTAVDAILQRNHSLLI